MLHSRSVIISVLALTMVLVASACAATDDATDAVETTVTVAEEEAVADNTSQDDAADHADDEETAHDEAAEHGDDEEATHDEAAEHSDDEAAEHGDGTVDRVIPIIMTDLAFAPERLGVIAGETIRFEVRNDGAIVHEFRLSNAHRIDEHIASGHEDHHGEGGHHDETDIVLELDAGESGVIEVTFPEDTTIFTEIACLIPGHYEAGMKAELIYA